MDAADAPRRPPSAAMRAIPCLTMFVIDFPILWVGDCLFYEIWRLLVGEVVLLGEEAQGELHIQAQRGQAGEYGKDDGQRQHPKNERNHHRDFLLSG